MPGLNQELQNTNGGNYRSSHAAGTTGSTNIYTGAGRLCKVSILTVGTALTAIYDGTDNTGPMIFQAPTNPTVGQVFDVQVPFTTGLYFQGITTVTHGACVTYNKSGVNGQ
jgi:hypothetical protein